MKRQLARTHPTPPRGRARSRLGAALAVLCLLGLAAAPAAEAGRPHSLRGAVAHLRAADRALARLVAAPAGPLAGMYLTRSGQQTALAAGVAQAIVARARGRAGTQTAATALGLLADHQTSAAQELTSILGVVAPELQAAVAQAISTATGGRQVVLAVLSGLLPDLSAGARPVVAQVVAMESSQGVQVPVALAGVLGGSSVACQATGAVQQALVVATQAFQLGLAGLGQALALVPPAVQAQVQTEIDGVPDLLRHIEEQLAQAVPCSASTQPAGAAGTPVAALRTPALLGGMSQLIGGILGRVLPGLGAGQTPAPVAAPAPLSSLLGGVGGLLGGGLGGLWPGGLWSGPAAR